MGSDAHAPAGGGGGERPLVLVKTISGKVVENGKVRADYQIDGLPRDDGEFEFVFVAKVPSLDISRTSNPLPAVIRADRHVISVQMNAVGGTPIAGERVRIVDPDSGEVVAEANADDEGRVVATVPENKTYDLRVVDDDDGEDAAEPQEHDPHGEAGHDTLLLIEFVDASGQPLANEAISLRGPSGEGDGRTDGEGKFEVHAEPGAYEVQIRGKRLIVHTLYEDDLRDGRAPYRVVVT